MTPVLLYVLSLIIVLAFMFCNGSHHREGGVIVAMAAFVPLINFLVAASIVGCLIVRFIMSHGKK